MVAGHASFASAVCAHPRSLPIISTWASLILVLCLTIPLPALVGSLCGHGNACKVEHGKNVLPWATMCSLRGGTGAGEQGRGGEGGQQENYHRPGGSTIPIVRRPSSDSLGYGDKKSPAVLFLCMRGA
jgi:hypothetical protein